MKRFILALCIFLLLIGTCLFGLWEVHQIKNDMIDALEKISDQMQDGDVEAVKQSVDTLKNNWVDYEYRLVHFVGRTPLNEISSILEGLSYYMQYDDIATFYAELYRTKSLIEHIWYAEIPILENIF
mgnify:CR=1 FL=1